MLSARILTLVDQRYREQNQPNGMVCALRALGAEVEVLDDTQLADERWRRSLTEADVAVARGRRPGTLAALEEARRAGLPVVDSAIAVEGVRDKRRMTRTLREIGVPTPRTALGTLADVAASELRYPIILKPVFGDNASGLVVVETPEQLAEIDWPEPEVLAQEYHRGPGVDLKLYVIDGDVTAVRKPSPITRCTARPAALGPVTLSEELRELARRCSEGFGLIFFGVDCLEVDGELQVLEVNDFPNYSSVPRASQLLARHVLRRAGSCG
ncbi:MAG: ATP-grasp domain-containing protein [Pseudoclavibacter sp.]|nr:ATP-grasp domain-containing protein [Pseudoclavibacter sp.]